MPAERRETSRRAVGSVARATQLVDVLAASDTRLGVNELARRIGVNASTASRLLSTLQDAGLVMRTDGGPYRLGPAAGAGAGGPRRAHAGAAPAGSAGGRDGGDGHAVGARGDRGDHRGLRALALQRGGAGARRAP